MIRSYLRFVCCLSLSIGTVAAEPLAIAPPNRSDAIDFNADILPILKTNCLACHSESEHEGDLVLETAASIRTGGSSGAAVVPGNSAESYLLQLATHQDEPVMPPEDNDVGAKNLTPEQLGLIKLWIDQGAKDGTQRTTSAVAFRALPRNVDPILAAVISADGRLAVCSRGNRLFVYETVSGDLIQELMDPDLQLAGQPTETAHLDLVQSLTIDAAGQWIASGGFRNVKLWQRQNRAEYKRYTLDDVPTHLALSPDGKHAAVALASGVIQLIALDTGEPTRTLSGQTGYANALAFAGEDRVVASASDQVRIWRIADGALLQQWSIPAPAQSLVWTTGRVVTGHDDHIVRIWRISESGDPTVERELSGHSGPITSLAIVPKQPSEIVSGSADGTVRTWNLAEGRQLKSFSHESPVLSVAVHHDGSRIASTGDNCLARVWNAGDGQKLAELKGNFQLTDQLAAIDRQLTLIRAEIEASKGRIGELEKQQKSRAEEVKKATDAVPAAEKDLADKTKAASDAKLAKNDADQNVTKASTALAAVDKLVQQIKEKQSATSETGDQLNTGLQATRTEAASPSDPVKSKFDEITKLVETLRNQQNESFNQLVAKADELRAAADQQIAEAKKKVEEVTKTVTDSENAIKDSQRKLDQAKLNVKQRERDHQRSTDDLAAARNELSAQESQLKAREGDRKSVTDQQAQSVTRHLASSFSASRNELAVATEGGEIYLHDALTGAPKDRLSGHQAKAVDLAWAGDRVVSVAQDKQLIIWNTQLSWNLARTLGGVDQLGPLTDRVLALDFSADSALLAVGSGEPSRSGSISIWNVSDGTLARAIEDAHSDTVFGLEFSPDGKQLASCAADRMAKLFNVADGTFVRNFEGHTHHVLDVAWQANGKSLATAGADNVIKIWNAATGEQRRTIGGIGKEVTSVAYAGIAGTTISSSGDTNIRIHNSGDGKMIRSMNGGGDFVYTAAVSDDGKRIVSGGVKSILHLWNADDGKLVQSFNPPGSAPE